MTKSVFDATPSLLGYIYQVRYALLVGLQKAQYLPDIDDCTITIETIDDISTEINGNATDLIQTKYHISPGNLTNKSPDIWGTVRVWCEKVMSTSSSVVEYPILTLLTTETVASDSLAEVLSITPSLRNETKAFELMNEIASLGGNKANDVAYKAFLELEPVDQMKLISLIYVLPNAPDIQEVKDKIARRFRLCVPKEHIAEFTSRVEGKWFTWAIDAMTQHGSNSIALTDLISFIENTGKEYSPTSLPIDYELLDTDEFFEGERSKDYITQLKFINANDVAIKTAIKNCVKARKQRSSWHRQGLLLPGELKRYEARLTDEWENHFGNITSFNISDTLMFQGASIYKACQSDGLVKIRSNLNADFVARGSYHMLSDERKIGWHPQFECMMFENSDNVGVKTDDE